MCETPSPGCPTDGSTCLLWFSISVKSMNTSLLKLGTLQLSFNKLGISLIQLFYFITTNLPGPVLRAGDTVVNRRKPVLVFMEL